MAFLRENILDYIDRWGFVAPSRGGSSNNGVLYTAEWYINLARMGMLTPQDVSDFKALITQQAVIRPGLIERSRGCADQEGPDDYIGLMAAYWALGLQSDAVFVVNYGLNNPVKVGPVTLYNFYNNVMPGTPWENAQDDPGRKWYLKAIDLLFAPRGLRFNASAWLGRQPQLMAHFQWSAGLQPAWWQRLWAAVTVALATFKDQGDMDSRILSFLVGITAEDRCWMMRLAFAYFMAASKRDLGGMVGVYSRYFQPDHPITKTVSDK